jgi:hypothetical protein
MGVQFSVGVDIEYAGEDATILPHRMEAKTVRAATWTMSSATYMRVLMLSDCLHGHHGWQPTPQLLLLDTQRDGSDFLVGPLLLNQLSLNWLKRRRRKDSVILMGIVSAQVTTHLVS